MKAIATAIICMLALPGVALSDEESPTKERVDLLIKAIRDNGCKMNNDEAPKLLPPLGFTRDETRAIARALFEDGRATRSADGIALSDEVCKG